MIPLESLEPTVGDPDPLRAITDALRSFPADEIVVVTRADDEASRLEQGVVAAARDRFDVPVTHLAARSAFARLLLCCVAVALAAGGVFGFGVARAARPVLSFRVFANTGHNMDAIVWSGGQFLYVENTANTVWAAPAAGLPLHQFASMPNLVEETRCVPSPAAHGFPAGVIFCHSPDDKIYEISASGASVTVFATLPVPSGTVSDGALTWDDVGRFGYQLVAATGRSGSGQPPGGAVFTISAAGAVRQVGTYSGPGADEVAIAPAGFGSAGGSVLLTLDGGADSGALVAMDASGNTRTLVSPPGGLPPIAAIPAAASTATRSAQAPPAGLYVTNDVNPYVYFAPASQLAAWAGDVIVGSENKAQFWIVAPRAKGFVTIPVRHTLRGGKYSLEGSVYVP